MTPSPSAADAQFIRMTETPIPRLIGKLAVPTIVSMMITSIYNLADTFFVSKLGTSATGAVGVVFSLMAIIQAVGFMLGMGSGGYISRLLGQKQNEKANEVASSAFFIAAMLGIAITLFGTLFLDTLMRALGATETILPYAEEYAQVILLGAPFMCTSFVMNNDLRAEGRAVLAMLGIGFGGLLNMVLDPVFIFTFDMGIQGAAIATVLSQVVSFAILISHYIRGRSAVRIRLRWVSRQRAVYWEILRTGAPSFFRQGLASVASVMLNRAAGLYGDAAIAAMSVVSRVFMFILSALLGFGQGFQPVAGYNYGARRYDRLRQAYFFCLKVGVVGLFIMAAIGFLFAPDIMAIFRRDDPLVIAIGSRAFRLQCALLPFQALVVISNMLFQSTGQAKEATLLAVSRQGLFFLPLILLLPALFDSILGVQLAQPIADLLTALLTLPLVIRFWRKLSLLESQGKGT